MKGKSTTTSGLEWNTFLSLTQQLKRDKKYRDYLMIITGCYFGLRISDLLSIRWIDVLDKDELIITERKTKKQRRITINQSVKDAVAFCYQNISASRNISLGDYMLANRWNSHLTISYVNKQLKVIFREYKVYAQNCSSHTLRKTFGKRVFENNNRSESALVSLSEIFSHSSVSVTRRYIGLTQEKIANIYLGL